MVAKALTRLATFRTMFKVPKNLIGGHYAKMTSATPLSTPGDANEREGKFYGRVNELASLQTMLSRPPGDILVITGEPSVGKSRLVREAINNCGLTHMFSDLNLRHHETGNWKQFIEALYTLAGGSEAPSNAIYKPKNRADFGLVLRQLRAHWERQRRLNPGKYPVLLVDEAQFLTRLQKHQSPDELALEAEADLLLAPNELAAKRKLAAENAMVLESFFTQMISASKDHRIVHVIFCSSDAFYWDWMKQRTALAAHLKLMVVGDVIRSEAQQAFDAYVASISASYKSITDHPTFENAFKEAGGRPLYLDEWVQAFYSSASANVAPMVWGKRTARLDFEACMEIPAFHKIMRAIAKDKYCHISTLTEAERIDADKMARDNIFAKRDLSGFDINAPPGIHFVARLPYDPLGYLLLAGQEQQMGLT